MIPIGVQVLGKETVMTLWRYFLTKVNKTSCSLFNSKKVLWDPHQIVGSHDYSAEFDNQPH